MLNMKIERPRGKFRVYEDKAWEFRWKIISSNGKTIGASSEWFKSESYCIENAKLELLWIFDFLKQLNEPTLLKGLKPALIPLFSKLWRNG